jgi:predicted oxidoreductase
MKSTEPSPSAEVLKKSQPEEFDLVILGGGTGSTVAAWTFAGEGKRIAVVDREFAASVWELGKVAVADQCSCPRNKRMPISTLRSTFAWPAGVGMRCPQDKHSWRATRPTWTCLPSSGPESRTG